MNFIIIKDLKGDDALINLNNVTLITRCTEDGKPLIVFYFNSEETDNIGIDYTAETWEFIVNHIEKGETLAVKPVSIKTPLDVKVVNK